MSKTPHVMKRRRVAKACEKCRLMKSKCDGLQPICSRCHGYGYSCVYVDKGHRSRGQSASHLQSTLHEVIDGYEKLILSFRSALTEPDRAALDLGLNSIRARIDDSHQTPRPDASRTNGLRFHNKVSTLSNANSQRYLGEASDVHFFNLVKRMFQDQSLADRNDEEIDSYEQDDRIERRSISEVTIQFPEQETAKEYIDIYFSTIHIAYPFVSKTSFIREYDKLRQGHQAENMDASWLALLYTVLAIGAYYTSFPSKLTSGCSLHEQYFQLALSFTSSDATNRTLNHVCSLLAQCFYLLAICRTDRCWTTLGLAVRIAQSAGLHVESMDYRSAAAHATGMVEMRRRVWYSIYVLDRLLALQLGRPPAIHDEDCHVQLPSRLDDAVFDGEGGLSSPPSDDAPSTGDYFLCVIKFSILVGHVLRDIYSPLWIDSAAEHLLSTSNLDKQLLDWKLNLPRTLRFDLGHAFEKSITFKRQRNMLAIKFHHLRALIHRPYLCLSSLRRYDSALMALLEHQRGRVDQLEKICISEAQKTAHLLHNVVDERSLVHDFPWWQMISCLICASSILLVASALVARDPSQMDLDGNTLGEDAETCLKVFEALSINSDAARVARVMMEKLKDPKIKLGNHGHQVLSNSQEDSEPTGLQNTAPTSQLQSCDFEQTFNTDMQGSLPSWQLWPSEISDSMTWSAQFFHLAYNPGIESSSVGFSSNGRIEGGGEEEERVL